MSAQQWFDSIPVVTRCLFTASFALTLLPAFGFLSSGNLVLSFPQVAYQFQLWRLVTCFFVHGLGLPFVMNMVFLYRYSGDLEGTTYKGRTADYLWFIVVGSAILICIGLWWPFAVLGKPLIIMIVYYWSREHAHEDVTFFFNITFKAVYFPWALCAMNILLGGSPLPNLVGIAVGHMFFYLDKVAPVVYGVNLVKTPQFLFHMMDPSWNINSRYAPTMESRYIRQAQAFRGAGHRLGSS